MRSFLDTSVLIYADDGDEPARQARAVALIAGHRRQGTGVLSTQVLQEYANVALRRLGLPVPMIRERLAFYARFEVVAASPALIAGALDLHALRGFSFCDALIVQAAVASGCAQLLTEGMHAGDVAGGVRIVNPF